MRRNAALLVVACTLPILVFGCHKPKQGDESLAMGSPQSTYAPMDTSWSNEVYPPVNTYGTTYGSEGAGSASLTATPAQATYAAPTPANVGRYHTVQRHETLYSLARKYYNDQRQWKKIYEANRDQLADPNRIFVGQELLIP